MPSIIISLSNLLLMYFVSPFVFFSYLSLSKFHMSTDKYLPWPVKVPSSKRFKTFLLPTPFLSFKNTLSLSTVMERSENGRRRRVPSSKEGVLCAPRQTLSLPPAVRAPAPVDEVKLAAIAVDLNIRLRSAEMPGVMQERAFKYTRGLLDANTEKRPNPTHMAMCLKKEFDTLYGPAWHCIVGKSFGSFVTHSTGGFIYFSCDKLSFLLFKTEVRPVIKSPPLLKFNINA